MPEGGEYEIRIEFVGYESHEKKVVIGEGQQIELSVSMVAKAGQLADVGVFGRVSQEEEAGARQKEKRSANIVNVISVQAVERSPDINAANVLQRVSGVTIQGNGGAHEAYPIVRGLDPRYSNTLINGSRSPVRTTSSGLSR